MVMGVLDKLTKAQQLMENIATATSKGKYSEAASSLIMLEEAFKQSTCEREEEVGCFFLFFLQLYCPIGISPIGNSDCFPQESQL